MVVSTVYTYLVLISRILLNTSSTFSEWYTFSDWLKVDMRQILVETHNGPMPNGRDFFFNLHDAGFVIFSKEANYENAGKLFYLCICDV